MLKITHATKKYTDTADIRGINDISFSISSGEIVCVLG
jgi:ABC-type Na+ transport system ATPase subunit NatA